MTLILKMPFLVFSTIVYKSKWFCLPKFSRNSGKNNVQFFLKTMTYFLLPKVFLVELESQNYHKFTSIIRKHFRFFYYHQSFNDKPCLLSEVNNLNILTINWTFYPNSFHPHGIAALEHIQCLTVTKDNYSHLYSMTVMT